MPLIIILMLILPHNPDLWRSMWNVGFILSAALLCHAVYRKIGSLPALALMYFCYRGLEVFASPYAPYGQYGLLAAYAFDAYAAGAFVALILAVIPFLFFNSKTTNKAILGFEMAARINVIFMIYHRIKFGAAYGFLSNEAMDACFVASIYPMIIFRNLSFSWNNFVIWKMNRKEKLVFLLCLLDILLPIAAILASMSTIALCCLGVMVVAFLLPKINPLRFIPLTAIFMGGLFFVGKWLMGVQFLNDSGRFTLWKEMIRFLKSGEFFKPMWGGGLGTFQVFAAHLQIEQHIPLNGWYLWAHNDFLQVFFETGIIGIALFLLTIVFGAWRIRRNEWLFPSCCVFTFCMIFQGMLHFWMTGFLGCLLIFLCYHSNNGRDN
jgi:hypothetical protein